MNESDEILKRHLLDLSAQAERQGAYTFSGFLSLPEQDLFLSLQRDFPTASRLFGGNASAERKLAVFGSPDEFGYEPELPIAVIAVSPLSLKYGEALSHPDYLGALLNLGIDRSLIGDIIIREKQAWFFCLESAAAFLSESLTKVRHTDVRCERVFGDIPELEPVLEEIRVNVASERLDAIVAAYTGISRSHVEELFTKQRVFVNGRVILKESTNLKEGDVLNVRGFGKAIYGGIDGTSKKGRLYVVLKKYS